METLIKKAKPLLLALPQKSDYSRTFRANCISAPKINLTDGISFSEDKYSEISEDVWRTKVPGASGFEHRSHVPETCNLTVRLLRCDHIYYRGSQPVTIGSSLRPSFHSRPTQFSHILNTKCYTIPK
jgi:hypothetical protein